MSLRTTTSLIKHFHSKSEPKISRPERKTGLKKKNLHERETEQKMAGSKRGKTSLKRLRERTKANATSLEARSPPRGVSTLLSENLNWTRSISGTPLGHFGFPKTPPDPHLARRGKEVRIFLHMCTWEDFGLRSLSFRYFWRALLL